MKEKEAIINGNKWNYLVGGSGDPVILYLHGIVGDRRSALLMSDLLPTGYRFIAPTIDGDKNLDDLCFSLNSILNMERANSVVVFGGSFGGAIAQAFFNRYRSRITELILLSTEAPDRRRGVINAAVIPLFSLLPRTILRQMVRAEVKKHLTRCYRDDVPERFVAFENQLNEYFENRFTKEIFLARMRLFVEFSKHECNHSASSDERLGRILIIESTNDPMIGESQRKRLKEAYSEAEVYTFREGGHLIPLERPHELATVIENFLSKQTGGNSSVSA